MLDLETLRQRRLRSWRQDGEGRIEDPAQALRFLERVGIATLYAASPEFPSLYQAHMGDPKPPIFATWDSPSGNVYGWRWDLGRPHSAFYGVVVAKKPTWVTFDHLPVVLGALMERRTAAELFEAGELSADAKKLADAFTGTAGILSTKELRSRGGFDKGKENRAAYLKALEELDSRLWVAKRFEAEGKGDEMLHALVALQYPDAHAASLRLDPQEALAQLLLEIVRNSIYLDPKPLGRHLSCGPTRLDAALKTLEEQGALLRADFGRDTYFVSKQASEHEYIKREEIK